MPRITELCIYPIKSCRGISVDSVQLTARGLDGDRRYMLVDVKGRFLTQREHPAMALIDVSRQAGGYRVAAPGQAALDLPLALPPGRECKVRLWQDTIDASLAEPTVNRWFSDYLGLDCGLVHMDDDQHRPVQNAAASFDDEVSFADGGPLLLVSEASLAWLNARLAKPVAMRQFRPNIVTTAEAAFDEDAWRFIRTDEVELEVAWSCPRCVLTTIDPATARRDPDGEPLATLKQHRRFRGGVMFGQNLIPRKLGTIDTGAEIQTE